MRYCFGWRTYCRARLAFISAGAWRAFREMWRSNRKQQSKAYRSEDVAPPRGCRVAIMKIWEGGCHCGHPISRFGRSFACLSALLGLYEEGISSSDRSFRAVYVAAVGWTRFQPISQYWRCPAHVLQLLWHSFLLRARSDPTKLMSRTLLGGVDLASLIPKQFDGRNWAGSNKGRVPWR